MNRIDLLFERTRDERRLALLPYLTAGYPERGSTEELVPAMVEAGADGFELGVPFSDPIADGVAVQRSTAGALRNGMNVASSLEILGALRDRVSVPLVPMGYYNPFLQFGIDRLCAEAADRGADGFIVPDLPLDEAAELSGRAQACGLHLILFVAPTTTDERLRRVGEIATGFVYCVSLRGVTGARASLAHDLDAFLARVREHIRVPLAVGFGISRPEHVTELRGKADAAIVGSALVDLLDATSANKRSESACRYVASLAAAGKAAV